MKLSSQTRWNHANKLELWAHGAVRSALRRGIIQRQPSELGGAEPTDVQQDDYDKPLAIGWLRRLHHRQAHRQAKPDLEQHGEGVE